MQRAKGELILGALDLDSYIPIGGFSYTLSLEMQKERIFPA